MLSCDDVCLFVFIYRNQQDSVYKHIPTFMFLMLGREIARYLEIKGFGVAAFKTAAVIQSKALRERQIGKLWFIEWVKARISKMLEKTLM